MKKIIKCNLCGEDTTECDEFILPLWLNVRGGLGMQIVFSKIQLISDKVYICNNCKKRIADTIYEIQEQNNRRY